MISVSSSSWEYVFKQNVATYIPAHLSTFVGVLYIFIIVGLRRRSPWEAMDLGLSMLQRWWRQVYVPHLIFALPLMALAIGGAWWLERAWFALVRGEPVPALTGSQWSPLVAMPTAR